MRELITLGNVVEAFPAFALAEEARRVFESITSFEDLERLFLRGAGLSPETYRTYLAAVRQFYEFTEHLNPLQVLPADIEAFYDALLERGIHRNTAYYRIAGLKRFFGGVARVLPSYVSPFQAMTPGLTSKLNRQTMSRRTRAALTIKEINQVLAYLKDREPDNHAVVFLLVTSGLRVAELCGLRWRDLEQIEGQWTAYFVGKGGKDAVQELYAPAVEATWARCAFRLGRDPRSDDALYYSKHCTPMQRKTLWLRLHNMGQRIRAAGVVDREVIWSPHLFRRSYATGLYQSGMKIKAIQAKTRHASIDTLLRCYIHDEEKAGPYFDRMFTDEAALG